MKINMKIFNDALRAIQNVLNNDRYCFDGSMTINEYASTHPRSGEFVFNYVNGDKNAIRNLFLLARIDYEIEHGIFISDKDLETAIKAAKEAIKVVDNP